MFGGGIPGTLAPRSTETPKRSCSMGSRNLAGRMGRWSATHRKTAIFGWLAFVLVAVGVGMQFHQVKPENSDLGNGQSKAAAKAYESADFPDEFGEQVLI